MASVYIANALVAMFLALYGATLGQGQESNSRACVFDKQCICSGTRVICKNRQLRSIPQGIPLGTTVLDLSYNELSTLDVAKLSRLTNLQELLLHENQLVAVPPWQSLSSSLTRLSLHHNKITSIPSSNVTKPMSLQYLLLNSNRISSIGENAFAGLTSIHTLKLSRNRLTSVPVDALSHLTFLKKLDLTKNLVRVISSQPPLKNLKSVLILKLSKNKIRTVNQRAFWQMSNLRELYLDNNNLTSVSTSWFFGVSNLQKLSLNNNRINKIIIHQEALDWRLVLRLVNLNLAKNELSLIDSTTFAHLPNLQRLYLGSNSIYHMAEGAFSDLNSLEMLDLSNNALSSTLEGTNGVFSGLAKLIMLRLDGNRITLIAKNAFAGLNEVTSLNLSANIITSIEENAFMTMTKLKYLYLNTTQLVCNCKLSWLPAWLVGQEFKDYVHAVCLHPTHLERRSIFNLTSSDFICDINDSQPAIIQHPEDQKVLLGQNVTLRCVVTHKNRTVIVWTKDNKPLSGVKVTNRVQSKDGSLATYSSELRLVAVTEKDDGYYQCKASHQFNSVPSKMARITVLVFPKLTVKPSDVTVEVGQDFQLQCRAKGHPEPQIKWQGLERMGMDRRIGLLQADKVIVIQNATASDSGKYTCIASNEAGSVNASAFVTVLDEPHLYRRTRSEITAAVGDSAVFECYASGAPKPVISWFKDDKRLMTGSNIISAESGQLLVIRQSTENDEGSYTCVATNSQGRDSHTVELTIITEECTGVSVPEKVNKSKYVKYDKKTFLGIIVVVVVSCIVVTSLVWLFIQYNTLSCGKKRAPKRRGQFPAAFDADCTDESKAFQHEDISYIPLKVSSSSSTQTSRESPRSTATFLTSSESAQGPCIVRTLGSSTENAASGTEEKSTTADNVSSENSLKGSHSSLTSSCTSDACHPSYQQVVTSAEIHVSDSDSEKQKPSVTCRRHSSHSEDPGGGVCEIKLDIPDNTHCDEQSCLSKRPLLTNEISPEAVNRDDMCMTVYPLTTSDTSCVTNEVVDSSSVET